MRNAEDGSIYYGEVAYIKNSVLILPNTVTYDAEIKTLSKQQQKVIKLRYYSDLDYAQIAKKMKTTSGNVGFHLSTGLKNLRKKLLKSI